MASIANAWSALSPTAKRNLAVGGIGTVFIAAIIALASVSPEVAKPSSKQATIQHILTDSDPRSLGIDGISAQLRDLLQKNEEQSRRLAALEEQQKREQQSDEQRFKQWTLSEREAYDSKLKAMSGEVESLKNKPAASGQSDSATTPGTVLPMPNPAERRLNTPRSTPDTNDLASVFDQAAVSGPNFSNPGISGGRSSQNTQAPAALQIRVIKDEKASPSAQDAKPAPDQLSRHSEVFIPAGTILTGVLLNGLDAPTGKKSKKEPMPVLFRIKKEAILPNRFHADLRECFLLASGFGDLSAERAYFRGETFSCVRQDGGVIEVPMNAYATGEDGKNGVRGRVVSKQGALLAQAMMAASPVQKSRVQAVRLMKAPRCDEETAEVSTAWAGTYRPLAKTKNRPVRRIVAGTGSGPAWVIKPMITTATQATTVKTFARPRRSESRPMQGAVMMVSNPPST